MNPPNRVNRPLLRVSAPLRLSIAGGGTDLPEWYERFGARLITAAVDLRVEVSVYPAIDGVIPRSPLERLFATRSPVPVVTQVNSAVSAGAGLGGSSAIAVCLVAACDLLAGVDRNLDELAIEAFRWERHLLGEPVGFQDHMAAAHGGVRELAVYAGTGASIVSTPRDDLIACLDRLLESGRLRLVDTGLRRPAAVSLRELAHSHRSDAASDPQAPQLPGAQEWADALVDCDVPRIGALLRRQDKAKRAKAPSAVPPDVDTLMQRLRHAGSPGQKLIGAGGGGWLLIAVPDEADSAVGHVLDAERLAVRHIRLTRKGVAMMRDDDSSERAGDSVATVDRKTDVAL